MEAAPDGLGRDVDVNGRFTGRNEFSTRVRRNPEVDAPATAGYFVANMAAQAMPRANRWRRERAYGFVLPRACDGGEEKKRSGRRAAGPSRGTSAMPAAQSFVPGKWKKSRRELATKARSDLGRKRHRRIERASRSAPICPSVSRTSYATCRRRMQSIGP